MARVNPFIINERGPNEPRFIFNDTDASGDVGREWHADDCIGATPRFISIHSFIFISESLKGTFEMQIVALETVGNEVVFEIDEDLIEIMVQEIICVFQSLLLKNVSGKWN